MSKKMDRVWEAPPHTKAKIKILGAYLDAWLPILGRSRRGQTILYIDGFAGPGEYANGDKGSPAQAIESLSQAITNAGLNWIAGGVTCAFCEEEPERADNLDRVLSSARLPSHVRTKVMRGDFDTCMKHLMRAMPGSFRTGQPVFAFIDPFGVTGVPFGTVRQILESPTSEVLLNFDADGVARIYDAGEHANHQEILDSVFGGREWELELPKFRTFQDRCRACVELYMRKLKQEAGAPYVFRFEMRGRQDTLNYYLVFASGNHRGLEKMKEAMRQVDQDGSYSFSDGRLGQHTLFRFDDPTMHALDMHKLFLGRDVPWEQLRDYTLNDSPFVVPSSMLEVLEEKGMVQVTPRRPGRRRRQFTEDAILSVRFVEPQRDLFHGCE